MKQTALGSIIAAKKFDDVIQIDESDVKRVTTKEALYLPEGEVLMVRSLNVPELGDHYAVIVGPPKVKPHGIKPQVAVIPMSKEHKSMLDKEREQMGVTAFKLLGTAKKLFHKFYGITVDGGVVKFKYINPKIA